MISLISREGLAIMYVNNNVLMAWVTCGYHKQNTNLLF